MATPDSSQPIDIENELDRIFLAYGKTRLLPIRLSAWARSIAARVEKSTIERCAKVKELGTMETARIFELPRIYSAPAAKDKS